MAIASFASLPRHSTLAEFAGAGGWAKQLSDALTAVGVIKTPDTGQIDFAVVALPGAGVFAGYEIREITMVGGQTYYLKIEYGTGSGAGIPALRTQIGKTTNGAGVLGATDPSTQLTLITNSSATSLLSFVGGDATRFGFFLWADATTTTGVMLVVGRKKDDNGADNNAGINVVSYAPSGTPSVITQQLLPQNGPAYPAVPMASVQCAFPPSGSAVYGVNAGVFPVVVNEGFAGNPTLEVLVYNKNDQPALALVDILIYGVSHRFICCRGNGGLTINGNTSNGMFAIRYE